MDSTDGAVLGVDEYSIVAAVERSLALHVMIVDAAVGAGLPVVVGAVAGEEGIHLAVDICWYSGFSVACGLLGDAVGN